MNLKIKDDKKMRLTASMLLAVGLLLTGANVSANVRLPKLVSDNMVLQRDTKVPVWGWAAAGEKVTVQFKGKTYTAQPAADGKWQVTLPAMPAGGPYDMIITGKNTISVKNILLGDVWLGSGQSNMEFSSAKLKFSSAQLGDTDFPNIRLFTVENDISAVPIADVKKAEWKVCNKANAYTFSATAFFFARELHQQEKIPVGIILSAWGGTKIESWMSSESVKKFPQLKDKLADIKSSPNYLENIKLENEANVDEWEKQVLVKDAGYKNGMAVWSNGPVNGAEWKEMKVPAPRWEATVLPDFDGVVWLRKEFTLPAGFNAQKAVLHLGPIDDRDQTWLNGSLVGESRQHSIIRKYPIKAGILKPGKNVLAVRVIDLNGRGGMYGKPKDLFLADSKTAEKWVELSGTWQYRVSIDFKQNKKAAPHLIDSGPNSRPTLLYNAMIKPLMPYAIKGIIWYQGESNASQAYQYRELFPEMITDWRTKWGQGNFPFLFVQLANYMKPDAKPVESKWAELREAQAKALGIPNTAMAVSIDIGEADNIHPKNKQEVGKRLVLAAQRLAYHKNVTYSGPLYKSMRVEGSKIYVTFDHVAGGLITKNGESLKGFAIAGADRKFIWANARLEGNTVVVSSDQVATPVAVRYAWANNPDEANLYNKANLPASPFRTDDWPGLTLSKK